MDYFTIGDAGIPDADEIRHPETGQMAEQKIYPVGFWGLVMKFYIFCQVIIMCLNIVKTLLHFSKFTQYISIFRTIMALKLLADTHIAKQVTIQLRAKDVDIVRLEEVDDLGNDATDIEILEYATVHQRVVLSLDNDFEGLHFEYITQQKAHKGIFLGNKRLQGNIGTIVNFILEYHELFEDDDDLDNQLIYFK